MSVATNAASSAPLSRSATLQLTRRKSSKDRIRDILEGARERAESLDPDSVNVSPRLQPLLERSRRASDPCGSGGGGGSPAGHNGNGNGYGVVTSQPERQRTLNYQSTVETSPARRRSALSRKSSALYEGPLSPQQTPGRDSGGGNGNGAPRERPRAEREESGWKRTLRYFKSVELENKGSVARDHLALERTFLAWLRTSLAFASIGIAITQLFRLNTSLADNSKQAESLRHMGKPLGTAFLVVSILILLLGYNRYLQGQNWVIKGKFPASRGTIMLVALIAFTVTLASLIVILTVQSGPT